MSYSTDFNEAVSNTEEAAPWYAMLNDLKQRFSIEPASVCAVVSTQEQRLYLFGNEGCLKDYSVSTSQYGTGGEDGSEKTPVGPHRIAEKIGAGEPPGRIFRGREPTDETADIITAAELTDEDHITTRILRLEGLQDGVNRGAGMDSYERYIYLHGTHEEGLIGNPASHGCIRLTNADIIELFERLDDNALVLII